MQDTDVDSILKFTGTEEDLDGNIKYEGKLILLCTKIQLCCAVALSRLLLGATWHFAAGIVSVADVTMPFTSIPF